MSLPQALFPHAKAMMWKFVQPKNGALFPKIKLHWFQFPCNRQPTNQSLTRAIHQEWNKENDHDSKRCWNKKDTIYNWKYLASQLGTSLFNLLQFRTIFLKKVLIFLQVTRISIFSPFFVHWSSDNHRCLSHHQLHRRRCQIFGSNVVAVDFARKMKVTESQSPFGFRNLKIHVSKKNR